ncbi:hypothetical protein K439DRAFT_1623701 [Ramaria rubella]|nr:hypothetical protein K439DRAFT_1623701 [Ramaria rubella]
MSQLPEYIKHLPYMLWVVKSVYYTEIFSVEFWKSTSARTFLEMIKQRLIDKILSDTMTFIDKVALAVDALESTLCRDHLERRTMGLESILPETDILNLSIPKCLVAGTHPLDVSKANIKPILRTDLNPYINITPQRLGTILTKFTLNRAISSRTSVNWSTDPQASVSEVATTGSHTLDPETKDNLIQHYRGLAQSSKFHSLSHMLKIAANISVLACSALFFLHSNKSATYFEDLTRSLDHIQMEPVHKQNMLNIFKRFKGQKHPFQISLILAALAHSPLFVLDSTVELGEKSLKSVHITGTQAIMSASFPPPITSSVHMIMEREIWKHMTSFIGALHLHEQSITPQVSFSNIENMFLRDGTQVPEEHDVSFMKEPFQHQGDLRWKPALVVLGTGSSTQDGECEGVLWKLQQVKGLVMIMTDKGKGKEVLATNADKASQGAPGNKGKGKDDLATNADKAPQGNPGNKGKPKGRDPETEKGKGPGRPVKKQKLYHMSYNPVVTDFRNWIPGTSLPTLSKPKDRITLRGSTVRRYQLNVVLTNDLGVISITDEPQTYWAKDQKIFESVINNTEDVVLYNPAEPYSHGLPIADCFPFHFFDKVNDSDVSMDYIDMCERLIADRPIHIPSPKRQKISPDLSKERNLECEDLERCLQLNVSLHREAHDLQLRDEGNYLNEIVSTTMREVIEDHQPAVNFLDIPSPAGVFPPHFLRGPWDLASHNIHPNGNSWPHPQLSQGLTMMQGSIPCGSTWNVDANFGQYWLEKLRKCPLTDIVVKKHKWKVFLLEEDDILIMPPGTVHIVLTVKAAVAEGGHFYSKYSLIQSFMTGLWERRNGAQDTNTQHIGSELVLQGLASSYVDVIQDISPDKMPQFGSRRYHQILGKLPPLPQLAALLAMVGHPEFFEPECPDDTAFSCPEQLLQLREEAIEMVKTLLAFSPDLCGYFYEFQTMLGCIQLTNLKDHTIRFLLPESYVPEGDDELDELPESEEDNPPNTPNPHFTHNEVDGSDIGIELMEVDERV